MDFVFRISLEVILPAISTTRYVPCLVDECKVLSLPLGESLRVSTTTRAIKVIRIVKYSHDENYIESF